MSNKKYSEFINDAEFRMLNRKWLRYSSNIARRILAILKDNKELNQTLLAEKIGVKPQYISKVLKGQENLSLETIAKLSAALNTELITFPDYKYSAPTPIIPEYFLVISSGAGDYDGYARTQSENRFPISENCTISQPLHSTANNYAN